MKGLLKIAPKYECGNCIAICMLGALRKGRMSRIVNRRCRYRHLFNIHSSATSRRESCSYYKELYQCKNQNA